MLPTITNLPPNLLPTDGEAFLYPGFYAAAEAGRYFQELLAEISWRQEQVRMFGKWVEQPRRIAWHGDPGKAYTYSGLRLEPAPWTPALAYMRERLNACAGVHFNSVLLNLYRDGRDSMGWHSDDEAELGPHPVIASLSFGGVRRFRFRHRRDKSLSPIGLDLPPGSLLLMRGATQHHWQHCLPKTARQVAPRINLTFRVIG